MPPFIVPSPPSRPLAHILSVEDQLDTAELIRCGLGLHGIQVSAAFTGEQGLRAVRTLRFDLILLDAVQPGISGMETCRQLKEDEQVKDIPVLFFSSRPDPAYRRQVMELGAVEFLTKDTPFPQLAELILKIVQKQ